jgi:multicomponent Na+:H+ antiporter subunit D
MVLGLALVSVDGLTGGIVHLMNHAVTKSGLFLVIACVVHRLGSSHMDAFSGLGKRMPWTAAAFVVGGLGMIGVPTTAGFVSKWYLVLGAVEGGHWLVAGVLLFSSLLAILYVWKVVEVMYFRPPSKAVREIDGEGEAPRSMLVPAWLLLGASILFGLWTTPTVAVARHAARALLADWSMP